jgi:hypothetical protein
MPRIIPARYLDDGRPERIILHWTAGTHEASPDDRQHYHLIVEGTGAIERGRYAVAANDSTSDRDGYAAHTHGANTRSIGVALAGMAGSRERPLSLGPYPLTAGQWRVAVLLLADLCEHYRIPVSPRHVLTHAEVEPVLRVPQRGKWDITVHPEAFGLVAPTVVGDWLRKRVAAALAPQGEQDEPPALAASAAKLQRVIAIAVRALPSINCRGRSSERAARLLQQEIGTEVDGILGPATWARVAAYLAEAAHSAGDVVLLDSEGDLPGWMQYDISRGVPPLTSDEGK